MLQWIRVVPAVPLIYDYALALQEIAGVLSSHCGFEIKNDLLVPRTVRTIVLYAVPQRLQTRFLSEICGSMFHNWGEGPPNNPAAVKQI